MKKSLIALAAVAASGAALAQSSVTLYGVADVAVGYQTKNNDSQARAFASEALNNGTSRLGFRGVEDLGNGLKASFNFEQAVNLANGSASSGYARAAWVALSGDFGSIRAGRSTSPANHARGAWEVLGDPNYSVVANQFGYAGSGSRNDAQLLYITPSFGGFTGQAAYIFEDNRDGNNAKYELALIYKNGPLAAAINYADADDVNGSGTDANGLDLGVSYDFGSFKVAGSYHDGTFYERSGFSGQDYKGFSLGASVPFGAFSLGLEVAYEDKSDTTDAVVEAKYALSKRTFVYGVYGYNEKSTGKNGLNARPSDWGKDNFGLGIRHNF
ncbi:porin [Corticibacter populi]|nr:porin [Corticibacter populi]RZS30849.1 putative porin [Corticibacter populi]